MASNHERNVRGMHAAPRCEALTRAGRPCRSPAVSGKKRCKEHGGKGSAGKSYRREYRDYSKAYLHWNRKLTLEIRQLDKVIRKIERTGEAAEVLDDLMKVRRGLHLITKEKQSDLAVSYVPSEAELLSQLKEAAALDAAGSYSASGHRSHERIRDHARGAMVGLAVGEAVGITLTGMPRDTYRPIEDMVGGGIMGLRPGQWAGDTAMALALMESLTFRHGFDETDFMERLLEWRDDGIYSCTGTCVGLGDTTRDALAKYERSGEPIAGEPRLNCLANGSLARLAPVAIRYWEQRADRRDVAERQSLTTHAGPGVAQACVGFADILADAICGLPRSTVLSARNIYVSSSLRSIVVGEWEEKSRGQIRGSNNALSSLEAALWCVGKTDTFEEAVLTAANLGEDAGSTAALAGQLAGALYGACAIPICWIEKLAWQDKIRDMTDALFDQSWSRSGSAR